MKTAQSTATLFSIDLGDPRLKAAHLNSIWDGAFCTVMIALVETFAVAAAVSLNAPSVFIGVLGSLPLMLGSLMQLIIPRFVKSEHGRKWIVVAGTSSQAALLIVCALTGYLPREFARYFFVGAIVAYGVTGSTVSVFWVAWMKALTPEQVRGRLFARRNRIFAIVQLTCTVIAGLLTRHFTANTAPWSFYVLVFCIAGLARGASTYFIGRQYEPPTVTTAASRDRSPLPQWFRAYSIGTALFVGAASMAGPFFGVWYLRDLNFDYLSFSLCSASTVAGTFLFLPLWGKLADKTGNLAIMRLTAIMVSLIPLPYLFATSPLMLWIFAFYSGMCWSGFNLSNFNYLLLASGHERPERAIAVASAIGGIMVFAFGLLGGFLAEHLPVLLGYRLRSLFLLSALTRLIIVAIFFPLFRPLETKGELKAFDLFEAFPGRRLGVGIMRNMFRAARRM